MKRYLDYRPMDYSLPSLVLMISLLLPLPALAATVSLATTPLANATTSSVLPNLMFTLDGSGSMAWGYTPDYMGAEYQNTNAEKKICRDSGDDSDSTLDNCIVGDPPYMDSDMNSQYYNPAIVYKPGVNSDGTSKPSQSTPSSVLTDAYNKQNTDQLLVSKTSVDLTTQYPDRLWCTINNPSSSQKADPAFCVKNSDYLFPNAIYKFGRTSGGPNDLVTQSMLSNVIKVSGAPYYYSVVPTEYCTAGDLKTCILSSVPIGAYVFPAKSRWCSNTALTVCQAVNTSTYKYPRYAGVSITAAAATGSFAVSSANSGTTTVGSIKVNGIEIMGGAGAGCGTATSTPLSGSSSSTRKNLLAAALAAKITACTSNPEYTATSSGSTVNITSTAAAGATGNGTIVISAVTNSPAFGSYVPMAGGVTATTTPPYTFTRTNIVPSTTSYPKAASRTDCAGTTCTYAEEITNFGNWYAYYRTRMQGMKSAASLAFKPIGNNYRVGFIDIWGSNYLPINKFDPGAGNQKDKWYTKLFSITPSGGTPLRNGLSTVGRIFAGKHPVSGFSSDDPIQYSCQQNFALLTTDGYWNGSGGVAIDGSTIGDMDADSLTRPMYEGSTPSSDTLADVAKYYYDTDLRTTALGNCMGAASADFPSGNPDVCTNNVFVSGTDNNVKQHMTTFTLGLGVDGTLAYTSDYKTATSGDFYNLGTATRTGTVNWPVPVADNETAVDDLWHAAVNGQGTYFSAKDPSQLTSGLNAALAAINSKVGAGAAAATSTLNPVTGDNFAYVASYTTVKWTGNLEARSIDVGTGAVSETATWCAEDIVAASCAAPSSIVADTSGSSTIYNCVTPSSTSASCPAPGVLVGTDCKVEVPVACTGTMAAKVGATSDTRTIKMKSGSSLTDFTYSNLTTAGLNTNFDSTFLSANLSQWSLLTSTQQTAAAGNNLVNFLRGQNGYEDRASNVAGNRLYRYREAVLGDAVESTPAYVAKPTFSYSDSGYSDFKTAQASRAGTVYIGTNDGMLHAFDGSNGNERWAYVPSMVIPNMWKLADKNYSTMHTYYVNGDPIISDICTGGCSSASDWHTILVAGLNGGGRGYYALDITDPAAPSLLWEFDTTSDNDLGYTFGNPVITKKLDGTWVVLITSGYNNTTGSNPGKGFLYVLNAATGAKTAKIPTGVGDATTPSGLARITSYVEDAEKNNTATYTYGGDLLGNLWRFDINAAASSTNPLLFATLKDASGTAQPITTRPELGKINDKRVVFVGTGKYLETSDLTNTQQQTLYAIKDDNATATLVNPRTTLVEQTLTTSGSTRTATNNAVDFTTGLGWFVNFPDSGERQNVPGQLVLGTLLVPTTVPSNTVCSPGGHSWLNYFNYRTGGGVTSSGIVSTLTNAPIVGVNVYYINGSPVVSVVTADHPTPQLIPGIPFSSASGGFQKKRVIWRELLQ